jgi:NADH:ubiquinone oxidoreductase subunit 2 (subunit N)
LSSIFSLGWVITSIPANQIVWIKFIIGYGAALFSLILIVKSIRLLESQETSKSSEPHLLLILFLSLLILRGVPPFVGFFLKIIILKFLIFRNFFLSLTLVTLSLCLILVYLIIRFYLLSALVNFSLKGRKPSLTQELRDFLAFNILIRVALINIIFCKYYISNITQQLLLM